MKRNRIVVIPRDLFVVLNQKKDVLRHTIDLVEQKSSVDVLVNFVTKNDIIYMVSDSTPSADLREFKTAFEFEEQSDKTKTLLDGKRIKFVSPKEWKKAEQIQKTKGTLQYGSVVTDEGFKIPCMCDEFGFIVLSEFYDNDTSL